jgi:hypothetical protein
MRRQKGGEEHALCHEIKKGQNRDTEEGKNKLNPLAPEFNILNLPRATPISVGLDLKVDKDYILFVYERVQLVDTGFKGPLSSGTFSRIIGRSSN